MTEQKQLATDGSCCQHTGLQGYVEHVQDTLEHEEHS